MKKIKVIRQTTHTECGICCVAMIASYFKFNRPISYYRNRFNIGRDGTNIKDLYCILTDINLKVTAIKINDITEYDFNSNLHILHTKNNHFIVVEKTTKSHAVIIDPAKGRTKVSLEELSCIFTGYALYAEPSDDFEKSGRQIKELRHLYKVIDSVKSILLLTMISSLIVYLFSLLIPITLKNIIDSVITNNGLNLKDIVFRVTLLIAVSSILKHLSNGISIKLYDKLLDSIKLDSVKHLFDIPYAFFDNRSQGNILFRLDMLSRMQGIISTTFSQIIISISCGIVILGYFAINYLAIIPILLGAIMSIGLYVFVISKILLRMQEKELSKDEEMESLQTELVTSMFQIKCLHLDSFFYSSFKEKYHNFKQLSIKNQKIHFTFNLVLSQFNTFFPLFILIIVVSINSIILSAGDLFLIYTLVNSLITYSNSFFNEVSKLITMKASMYYLNDMLDEPKVEQKVERKLTSFEKIDVINMSFKYNDLADYVVENLHLNALKGQKISIVGTSGSGKTSLVKILAGLYKPSNGKVLINNIELEEISSDSFNSVVSIVPQTPLVFNKTVRQNITLDDDKITDDMIIAALKTANFYSDVKEMPLGLNTYLSGQGGNLSGGQIQRLALARAIVREPQLLILDEATSSLDAINERVIYENLRKKNITTIIISHRLLTISDSDMIYVIDNNTFAERGQHGDLMSMKGKYYDLFNQQMDILKEDNHENIYICG